MDLWAELPLVKTLLNTLPHPSPLPRAKETYNLAIVYLAM